jgi:CheY-like chemotaxis protein
MPRMNGRELARAALSRHPALPVLYVSGYPEAVITRNGLLEPGLSLLRKPFEPHELLGALASALRAAPGSGGGG